MKKLIHIAVLLSLASLATGCASTYMIDRGRDAADIFTAAVGTGLGATSRVGPLHAGLSIGIHDTGLQGGIVNTSRAVTTDLFLIGAPRIEFGDGWCFYYDSFGPSDPIASQRGKVYLVDSSIPLLAFPRNKTYNPEFRYPWSYYTQIECQIGLLGSARIGFNPGELLDFLLGWTTIDIYRDDIEGENRTNASTTTNQPALRTFDLRVMPTLGLENSSS